MNWVQCVALSTNGYAKGESAMGSKVNLWFRRNEMRNHANLEVGNLNGGTLLQKNKFRARRTLRKQLRSWNLLTLES
ncbi:MAG: hypothetical protein ACTS6G_03525 [Candidatus Hodgkinia cicadicola]